MQKSKIKITFLLVAFSILTSLFLAKISRAVTQEDCLNKDVSQLNAGEQSDCLNNIIPSIINAYLPAQQVNKKNLAALQTQLSGLNDKLNAIATQLKGFEDEIAKREEDLAFTQKIFEQKTADNYRFMRMYDPITPFLFSNNASDAFREISLRQKVADQDKKSIISYANQLSQLKKDKDSLEQNKANLDIIQKDVAQKTNFLAGEVAKVDAYLATLSAKQQAFIAAKLQSLGISRSAYSLHGGCSSDINKSPGFSPAIGFYTFGVPNRVGMNQYGAWGRAKANQTYDQILHAYYNFDGYQDFSGITINVNNGNGIGEGSVIWSGSLEDYVKRIYEVPDNWTDNDSAALKAQAVAARSYVLAATNNGANSICANEYCQVFKTDPKGGNWEGVVNATTGKVMVQGGSPIKAWFSAVHGGYAFNSGDIGWSGTAWTKRMVDTPSGSAGSFSDLLNNAYDKEAQWFYCDWGARSSNNGTGWLRPDEVADIVNVILLARRDPSAKPHLYQIDKPNPEGTDTWDAGRVRQELGGSALTTVSNVSVSADFGSGMATSVNIDGQSFDAREFKDYFNLRAPSNIQIVGPLFNVETKSF